MAAAKKIYPNVSVGIITRIVVFGEAHFVEGEVDRIRDQVLTINPDLILHELPDDDRGFYKKNLPDAEVKPLETKSFGRNLSVKDQFKIRENSMIDNIKSALESEKYKNIVIVVGDTHLRSIKTKELGDPILYNYLTSIDNVAKIYRSPHREMD